jgi:D-alanyl-lipoteichoic acid acyltransferase DltB (MBOAT superfamily)
MSLISFGFAAFVGITALLFHASAARTRPALLCAVSLLFCALNGLAAAVALLLATAGTFYVARCLDGAAQARQRRMLLTFGIAVLVAHLVLIKLLPYLAPEGRRAWLPGMLAAFGASYYTLKLIGYLIDVFWGRYRAWAHPAEFAAFATFFPLLPAGPIQRASEFSLESDNGRIAGLMVYGLRRILWGLVKKVAVADQLGGIVDYIASGHSAHPDLLWLMTYLFPLQLYVDFSALTDIGIGTAAIFGVRAPENFAFPFFASSISEFWRRWHMSLTRWLGDYVFTPLRMATRSLGTAGLAISIIVNMALIGLWHAISYGWLLFGLINAAFLIADAFTLRYRQRAYKRRPWVGRIAAVTGPVLVFHMIAFSLVCFRAQTLPDIAYFFGNLLTGSPRASLTGLFYSYGRGHCAYAFAAVCAFLVMECGLYLRARGRLPLSLVPRFTELPRAVRWAAYYLALLCVGIASQQSSRFIYVQF